MGASGDSGFAGVNNNQTSTPAHNLHRFGLETGGFGNAIFGGTNNDALARRRHQGAILGPQVDEAVGETVVYGVNANV